MTLALWRLATTGGAPRLARGPVAAGPAEWLAADLSVADFLTDDGTLFAGLAELPGAGPVPADAAVLAPADRQPVWAAGVTYARSRDARKEEARDGGDVYDRVYAADRPELFVKALPGTAVGTGAPLGIRADSGWNVPEPELAVVADPAGTIRALTLGNDMSSRDIEGANPLYLPQAKLYDRSCGLGPALVPVAALPGWLDQTIELTIRRGPVAVFTDQVRLRAIRRDPAELLRWLFRANTFPAGAVLLTGTSLVPPAELTLRPGDEVTVAAAGLGTLRNPVQLIGAAPD